MTCPPAYDIVVFINAVRKVQLQFPDVNTIEPFAHKNKKTCRMRNHMVLYLGKLLPYKQINVKRLFSVKKRADLENDTQ
jgi:hypothetical protein